MFLTNLQQSCLLHWENQARRWFFCTRKCRFSTKIKMLSTIFYRLFQRQSKIQLPLIITVNLSKMNSNKIHPKTFYPFEIADFAADSWFGGQWIVSTSHGFANSAFAPRICLAFVAPSLNYTKFSTPPPLFFQPLFFHNVFVAFWKIYSIYEYNFFGLFFGPAAHAADCVFFNVFPGNWQYFWRFQDGGAAAIFGKSFFG